MRYSTCSLLAIFCLPLLGTAPLHAKSQPLQNIPHKWNGYIEFEARKGNNRDLAETEVFIPITQNEDSLLFLDVRGMFDNQDSEEGNIGIGYRKILSKPILGQKWIVGGYGFFDTRNTPAGNTFHQATIGLEALSENWDIRANAYIPETTEKEIRGTANVNGTLSGTQLRIVGTDNVKERSLPGFDAEIGYKLPIFKKEIDEIRVYGGGFHFDASGYDNVSGSRGRFELRWNDIPHFGEGSRLTLGAEIQHDDVRDHTAFAIARLRIPFQTFKNSKIKQRPLSPLERRMTESVVRDIDIVSGQQNGAPVNEAATITVNGQQVSDITILDANNNIPAAVTAAGAGATILIDGSAGQINLAAATTIAPIDNQNIIGGGAEIIGSQSGLTTTIGSSPTIRSAAGQYAFVLGGNNINISNINIDASDIGSGGIQAVSRTDIAFKDIHVSGSPQTTFGIDLINTTRATVSNSVINNVGTGMRVLIGTDNTINNVTISNTVAEGITISGFCIFGCATINNTTLNNNTVINAGTSSYRLALSVNTSGSNNTSTNPGTTDCVDAGGNTGSIEINGSSCP